ncbi:MAG: RusA family crossover junction endodeoxyribonuclease [Clostridiaceae bacterium]|nr:RusA family crossover junction endodeoxyribonuclease [Clostridiaceae bacterium]
MKFDIEGRLPGLNEMIDAAKQGKGKYQPYAMMKEEYTTMIGWLAKKLPKYEKVVLIITWYEPDRRRDPDNIMAGQKFILDGLVQAGVIPDDSQKYILGIYHRFMVDRKNPRVEVEIRGVSGEKAMEGQEYS